MQLSSRKSLPSIRTKTAKLVLACVLPSVLGFAALTYDFYLREREDILRDAERSAQALMLAVDRDLQNGETAAQVLASSPSLASGDLAAFHAQARSVLRPGLPVFAFVLSGRDGRPVLNSGVPYGSPLAPNGNAENIRQVARTGQARPSDLYRGGPGQGYLLSIDVPVRRGRELVYVLSVQFETEHMLRLIAEQRLPPGWTGQIFDSNYFIVARNAGPQAFIGLRARPLMIARLQHDQHGVLELLSREGVPVYAVFSRSAARGWSVTIGVPRADAHALLFAGLANILLGVAALLTIGFITAWIIGGRIGHSVRALCAPAAALGRGEPLVIPPMRIREAAEVAAALKQVEAELLGYRSGLETLVAERTDQLTRSKSLLDTVFASAPIGLCFLDPELRFVMVNDYLAAINAKPVAEHIGRTLPELLGPAGEQFEQAYREVLASGRPIIGREGSGAVPAEPELMRHWIVSYYPVFGPEREIVGVTGVVLDITERKRQDERMRDNEEQFRALYETSGDAHMLVAREAGFVGGNKAAAAIFGCATIEEFLHLSPATTSPEYQPDGRRSDEKAQEMMRLALETGLRRFEWLHQRVDGTVFNADVLLTSVNIGGKGIMQATVRDISERIAAETALRATGARLEQSEHFIRTVTDNLPGMVGYWDAELRCRFANRRYLDFFGRKAEDMLGQLMQDLMYDEQLARNVPYVVGVLGGKPQNFEREVMVSDGELRQTWANYIPDFDEQGEVRGFYVLISDISELKRTEQRLQELNEQLVQALDQAEMASSAKSEFLANMSHEIRTPMNAIMGLARLLEEAPLARRERDYVAKMKMATQSLLGILNDVLDFSKIEAGQLELESTSFSLDQLLTSVSVLAASNAWQKGVEPVFAVASGVPLQLVGDPMRLQQVLLNLIGNAIKFTEQGEVVLSVRVLEHAEGTVRLAFSVRDSGIGIAPEQQRTMFDAFSQGDSSTSRKYGGTGLGLAISRRLVHLMGGSIGVHSELGQGAEFTFDTRFGVADAAPALALPELPGLEGLSVLVVDDNASARAMLAAACAAFGWRVESADSGAAALELLRAARREERNYDLMFLDGAMPGLDGVAVLTYARADPGIVLPRCALMVDDQARERLLALAGDIEFDAILCKPVTPGALAEAIAELREGPRARPPGLMPAALAGRLRGLHILLVEDNPINQEVANYLLLYAGATVDIAANGRIAVSMLAEAPAGYHAVLMDIQMPVMNGYEAAEAIRAMGLALPIVAMTANAMEDDRQHAIAAGMNAHVAKPIDVDELVATLNRLTAGGAAREERAHDEAGAGTGGAEMAPPADIRGIDLKATLPRFGGNFANFVALFKRFESSQGGTLDEVRMALRGADRHSARQLVHRLRGVAANLGATEVEALALDFEQALRSAGDAELLMRLAQLDGAMATVLEAARELQPPQAEEDDAAQGVLHPDLNGALAQLLALLQNNNMKALAQFEDMRAALAPAAAAALADAIETLSFAKAAALVQDFLNRKDSR